MANHTIDINCLAPDPPDTIVKPDDVVIFINNTGAEVTIDFTNEDAFKPKKNKVKISSPGCHCLLISTLNPGTVYEWECPKIQVPRTGRIDP